jgi:hydroxymethylglutaryl-CoA lyase
MSIIMNDQQKISLIECPRDAMQGWVHPIPTYVKIEYLNRLLKVGFDILDFGSFVSPKAIPQLADTKDVIPKLQMVSNKTKLLSIIANTRGAEEAVNYDEIHYLGFPFSISETFQLRNTNKTIAASLRQVEEIQELCIRKHKALLIYISMGFGNPYGDAYNAETAIHWVDQLQQLGIKDIAMADTVGVAAPENITYIFSHLYKEFPNVNIGAHFHSHPSTWEEKFVTALNQGCVRFDSSIKGIGGCPMAEDDLVGNLNTENIISWCDKNGYDLTIDREAFKSAVQYAATVFQ